MLVSFLAVGRMHLQPSDALSVVTALEAGPQKAIARQLVRLLRERHHIELKHTNALAVVARLEGHAHLYAVPATRPWQVTGMRTILPGEPVVRDAETFSGAVNELIGALDVELAAEPHPRFAKVVLQHGKLSLTYSALLARNEWQIELAPTAAPGFAADEAAVRVAGERLRRYVEERGAGGMLSGALALVEGPQVSGSQLVAFSPRFQDATMGYGPDEAELLSQLEESYGSSVLREAAVLGNGRLRVGPDEVAVRWLTKSPGVLLDQHDVSARGLDQMLRRYRRVCTAGSASLTALYRRAARTPHDEPEVALDIDALVRLAGALQWTVADTCEEAGVPLSQVDEARGSGWLRASVVKALAETLEVGANDLLRSAPQHHSLPTVEALTRHLYGGGYRGVRPRGYTDKALEAEHSQQVWGLLREMVPAPKQAALLFTWAADAGVTLAVDTEYRFVDDDEDAAPSDRDKLPRERVALFVSLVLDAASPQGVGGQRSAA
jgi:hypothetical protein